MYVHERLKTAGLFVGIILMIIGIIFLAVPDRIAEFLTIFVGAIVTVIGLFRVISVITAWQYLINRVLMLLIGIVLFGAGIFMLFNPDITITIVGAIIGVIAIMLAIDRFVTASRFKKQANIWPVLISGLIHLAFGVGMIYSAIVVFSIIIILVGTYLLIAGIMFAVSSFTGY